MNEELYQQAVAYEASGSTIDEYTPHLGKWYTQIRRKWPTLTVAEKFKLTNLKSFQSTPEQVFNTYVDLCVQFEQEHKCIITPREVYKGKPIGKFITTLKKLDKCGPKFKDLLQKLTTLREWNKTRKPTDTERMYAVFDKIRQKAQEFETNYSFSSMRTPAAHCSTMAKPSDWDLLEVKQGASKEVIKAAYKAQSLKYHPDKSGGNAEKFKVIQAAYERLIS